MRIERIKADRSPHGILEEYRMTGSSGASVSVSNLGAGIVSVIVPDARGNLADVALGYASLESYMSDGPCMGKTPGRVANRIRNGRFVMNGRLFQLPVNNGPNHLHGGPGGFCNRLWDARIEGDRVAFTLESRYGDQGYPGTVQARAEYLWSDDNELTIRYSAVTDADTVVVMTNHAYFNLGGENSGTVLGHTLQVNARNWLPAGETLIPTGEIVSVAKTPMDFTQPKPLGQDIKADFSSLNYGKGYDACWAIDNWQRGVMNRVAVLSDPVSGRTLTVSSDQAGAQVYTGNWLSGSPLSKSGRSYNDYEGVAIECQAFPDSPNIPQFPSVVLRPGERYENNIKFRFGNI